MVAAQRVSSLVAGASTSVLGGRLVNGYIGGAQVYQDQDNDGVFDYDDANGNGSFDDGEELEPYALTSGDGRYELTIVGGGGSLIAEPLADTIDQSTGASVTSQFSAPSGATVISPISTLVDAGLSESQVKTALGIDSSIDILEFDPVHETLYGDDPDKALGFKSASVLGLEPARRRLRGDRRSRLNRQLLRPGGVGDRRIDPGEWLGCG